MKQPIDENKWKGDMYDPNEHNWLYHQQLIRGDIHGFFDLADRVPSKSSYCNFTSGVIKRHHGKISESLSDFRNLMKENDSPKLETVQAASRSLYLLGRYKAAVEALNQVEKARGEDSADWKRHLYMGQCYRAAGYNEKAKQHYLGSVSKTPNVDSIHELADMENSSGNKSDAIAHLKTGLDIFPDSHKLNLKHGEITAELLLSTKQGLSEEDLMTATKFLRIATETDSDGAMVLGAILQRSSVERAIVCYRQVYNENPTSPQLWNNLGVLCVQKSKKLAAMACLRRATYLGPMFWKAWMNLGLFYLRNGQLVASFNAFSHVLSLHRDAFVFSMFALNLQLLGQDQNAAKAYRKAKRTEHELTDLNEMLTCIYNRAVFAANSSCLKCNRKSCSKCCRKKLEACKKIIEYEMIPKLKNDPVLEPDLSKKIAAIRRELGIE